ncbi:MAG: EscU/YscU/HrcU family type III secretion system export apparatus switch protein [Candidatus Delongbacteria bacterium]|nr:EscU/YscU/HrcU family type III secretion system export apparatus switch protein [Candidatus Delongbacteria bacterium]
MKKDEELKAAVALGYKPQRDSAPKVKAKGRGFIAEKIIETAREYQIPIYEDPDLVQALMPLELEVEIPVEMYRAVAEVLAFIYQQNKPRS